ncbi:hypothetical protein MTBUT4_180064 [Magnetospirillum sp. UT-4]|nr:hypothetical protein MTBUT4_180064 [Magnetospirillum sp. UT-4]
MRVMLPGAVSLRRMQSAISSRSASAMRSRQSMPEVPPSMASTSGGSWYSSISRVTAWTPTPSSDIRMLPTPRTTARMKRTPSFWFGPHPEEPPKAASRRTWPVARCPSHHTLGPPHPSGRPQRGLLRMRLRIRQGHRLPTSPRLRRGEG